LELRAPLVRTFLSTRADADFRTLHVSRDPRLISADLTISNPLVDDPEMSFYLALERDGLLDVEGRAYLTTRLEDEIVHYDDVTFLLNGNFKNLLGSENYQSLLRTARTKLIPNLERVIANQAADCNADDPEGYFEKNSQALEALEALFPKDDEVRIQVEI